MSKDISQYIHYYLGCEIKAENNGSMTYTLNKIGANGFASFKDKNGFDVWLGEGWKPILRKLEIMTPDEMKELEATKAFQRATPVHQIKIMVWTAESYDWAFKKGFWLFGNDWFDEGYIIDKATLK